jgi:GTP-binding protein
MAGQFLLTIGDSSQLEDLFRGDFLKGHGEPRIAMVGRSNVGKSSLINALVGARGTKLARVSKEPGKTRCIHFYMWKEPQVIIADLPGYGFAKVSHAERDRWAEFIDIYMKSDVNLRRAVVLLDGRHGPTESDRGAIGFLSSEGIPVTFVMTKLDQIKTQSERSKRKKEVALSMKEMGFRPELVFWVSAKTGDGLKSLIEELSKVS